jgi:hypothetical protein
VIQLVEEADGLYYFGLQLLNKVCNFGGRFFQLR